MTQYYIIEIKRNATGELEHNVEWAFDQDPNQAKLKGESLYYAKLSEAAISTYLSHSVTLISDTGDPCMNRCYYHEVSE